MRAHSAIPVSQGRKLREVRENGGFCALLGKNFPHHFPTRLLQRLHSLPLPQFRIQRRSPSDWAGWCGYDSTLYGGVVVFGHFVTPLTLSKLRNPPSPSSPVMTTHIRSRLRVGGSGQPLMRASHVSIGCRIVA